MGRKSGFAVDAETKGLLDAVLLISSDLDLRGTLDRLIEASCALTGARYGFLGLLDENGVIADFVLHGMDPKHVAAIPQLPTGKGILGVLIEDPQPLRLEEIGSHPRSVGFPMNHPPMRSFLGVPVRVEGRVYGNLYLTEKEGGADFTEQDEILLDVLAQVAGFVIANARTHASSERRHAWLEASIAMSDGLAAAADVGDALRRIASHLCEVAEASLVAVVEPDGVSVAAEYRPGEPAEGGLEVDDLLVRVGPALALACAEGTVQVGARFAGSTVLVAPMISRLSAGHALIVVLDDGRLGVEGPDLELFATFADQASLALDRTQALSEREEHMLVADRDRIARDLHDSVIQRIFATALQLQGLRRGVESETAKDRLDEAVSELNATIRDIRSTIFELKHDQSGSLKGEVRALAREYVSVLGFTPFVRLRGPVDGGVSREIGEHLVATLREALSNVARHADADACVIEVEVAEDSVLLRVSDNGRGIGEMRGESGLRNVRRRALDFGGSFSLLPEDPHGTLLEWRVPLSAGSAFGGPDLLGHQQPVADGQQHRGQ